MEVTVIKMRHHGTKLSAEQLEQAARVHGHMEISYWILDDGRMRRKVKELVIKSDPLSTAQPLLKLVDPEQTQLKGDDMVYIGTETQDGQPFLQAWWVKHDPSTKSNGVVPYADAGKRATA